MQKRALLTILKAGTAAAHKVKTVAKERMSISYHENFNKAIY